MVSLSGILRDKNTRGAVLHPWFRLSASDGRVLARNNFGRFSVVHSTARPSQLLHL